MTLADLTRLPCPSCGRGHDLLALLDRASHASPAERWVAVRCPGCGAPTCVEVQDGRAAIGSLSPSSPHIFRPEVRVRQEGLSVTGGPEGLAVRLLHRRWFIPTRE